MSKQRLQSSMEYLMTYGWAFAIILVVLAALYFSGLFTPATLPNACTPNSGYICSSPSLHSGTISVIIGQELGPSWAATNILWVPTGVQVPPSPPSGAPGICPNSPAVTALNVNTIGGGILCPNPLNGVSTLTSGQTLTIMYTSAGTPPTPGYSVSGVLEVYYQTVSGGPWYQDRLGILTLKAA